MELHSLLTPATVTDGPATLVDADGTLSQPMAAELAFKQQFVAFGAVASVAEAMPETEYFQLPEPDAAVDLSAETDPVSDLIATLTGISAALPIRPAPRPTGAGELTGAPLPGPLKSTELIRQSSSFGENRGRERPSVIDAVLATEQSGQTSDSSALHSYKSTPVLDDASQEPELASVLTKQGMPPLALTQAGVPDKAYVRPDDGLQRAEQSTPKTAIDLRNQLEEAASSFLKSPDPQAEADSPVLTGDNQSPKSTSMYPEFRPAADSAKRLVADSAGSDPTLILAARPTPPQATPAAQATRAKRATRQAIIGASNEISLPRPEDFAAGSHVHETGNKNFQVFHGEANRDGYNRRTLADPVNTFNAGADVFTLRDENPESPLRALTFRTTPASSEFQVQPDLRSFQANTTSIIRQVADATITTRNEMVEITLSPEELGRVRMVLSGHERHPHLMIWADRPETLEQLRRNSDMLMKEFSDEGFSGATFTFQDNRHDDRGNQLNDDLPWEDRKASVDEPAPMTDAAHQGRPVNSVGSRRLDIRI